MMMVIADNLATEFPQFFQAGMAGQSIGGLS
jgi:hypothetical protein